MFMQNVRHGALLKETCTISAIYKGCEDYRERSFMGEQVLQVFIKTCYNLKG